MKGLFIPEITAEMFRNGCLESIEALMAEGEICDIDYEPEPRWIPCERELPELASYVLVSHVGTVFVDCLTMENGDLLFWETGVFLAEEIRNLAWMPLPEPWKGENE